MTSMERVLAAIQGTKADRRAVTLVLSLYGAKLTSCPLKEYYSKPQAYFEGQQAVMEKCRPDIMFTPFMLAAEGEAFGSEVVYIENSAPNIKKPLILESNEIKKLVEPDIDNHPRLKYIREATRLLVTHCKGETPIGGVLNSPIDSPALIMGVEKWLETLLFDPDGVKCMLEKSVNHFIRWGNTLLAEGVTFLVVPVMLASPKILTKEMIKKIVLPMLNNAFKEIKGPIVFHHGGNPLSPYLDLFATLPNVAAFALDSTDSFSEAREKVGEERVLLGNIDGPNLWDLSPEQVRTKCREILDDRSGDKHFIMATSSADVAYDTPIENIKAVVEAVEEYSIEKCED